MINHMLIIKVLLSYMITVCCHKMLNYHHIMTCYGEYIYIYDVYAMGSIVIICRKRLSIITFFGYLLLGLNLITPSTNIINQVLVTTENQERNSEEKQRKI